MAYGVVLGKHNLAGLALLHCGTHACPPGYRFGPAVRDHYLLHYVHRGRGIVEAEGKRSALKAGEIFIIRPGERTLYEADEGKPWEYTWVGFTCAAPPKALLEQNVLALAGVGDLFGQVRDCLSHAGLEWFVGAKLFELFTLLERRDRTVPGPAPGYVGKAVNYIQAHYQQGISVSGLAFLVSLERSYFCRIFKAETGLSPQQYIVAFRLEKAATLLAVEGMRPWEAARKVGYRDEANFSRMFKRRFGYSPVCLLKGKGE